MINYSVVFFLHFLCSCSLQLIFYLSDPSFNCTPVFKCHMGELICDIDLLIHDMSMNITFSNWLPWKNFVNQTRNIVDHKWSTVFIIYLLLLLFIGICLISVYQSDPSCINLQAQSYQYILFFLCILWNTQEEFSTHHYFFVAILFLSLLAFICCFAS